MRLLARLNKPWIHFILLGWLLYVASGYLFPPPKPVVGPLGEVRINALKQQWFTAARQVPTDAQLERMINAELDRDMLFQQGLAMELHKHDSIIYQRLLRNMRFLGLDDGKSDEELYQQALDMRLHLGDEVVKRRIIQVIEQLLLAANPPQPPSEADIAGEFERRREELRHPPRYSITQLYFSREREDEMAAAIARIRDESLAPEQALELSSPFLSGYRFERQSPDQLARIFGPAFVLNLQRANPRPQQWVGPVGSTYGQHYVWVSDIVPSRDATLEEVRPVIERDLQSRARAEALAASIARLRENYEVKR